MTEVEIGDNNATYAFFSIPKTDSTEQHSDESVDKAETVEDSGASRKMTHVIAGRSPKRTGKKKPALARQNTFILEEDSPAIIQSVASLSPRHVGVDQPSGVSHLGRVKSSYGIKSILERAEGISSLSPQVMA